MLQLLLEGGETYEDLATLLGVSADEVRARAAAALDDLAASGLRTNGPLVDYLLGQADTDTQAIAEAELAGDNDELSRVRRLHARLRLLYPAARLPVLPVSGRAGGSAGQATEPLRPRAPEKSPPAPEPPPQPEPPASAPPTIEEPDEAATGAPAPEDKPRTTEQREIEAERPAEPTPSLTLQQKRLLALMSTGGLVVVIIVLALTGTFGGSGPADSNGAETTAQTGDTPDDTMLTRAVLRPQGGGGNGAGVAIFGAVDEETPVLQVTARNLKPTADGEEYSVWLYQTDEIALRLAGVEVGRNGRIATQIQLPPEALNFIVDGTLDQIDISRNRKQAYRQELKASQDERRLPHRVGRSVLRGQITGPGLGAAANQ